MPPRSVKRKRRILGFQRRVWWPKWTPASRSSRIETTDTCVPFGWIALLRRRRRGTWLCEPGTATRLEVPPGREYGRAILADAARTLLSWEGGPIAEHGTSRPRPW